MIALQHRSLKGNTHHPDPKLIPLRHSGLTRMEAEGERIRYRPKGLLGGGGGGMPVMLSSRVSRGRRREVSANVYDTR